MLTKTVKARVTLTYANDKTRTYNLPVTWTESTAEIIDSMKTAIRNFNTAAATDGSSVKQTFLSDDGSPVVAITSAIQVTREEEVLYNG